MKYANAAALRAALDQRLVTEANSSRTDIARLRRRVTFERLLVRFALAGGDRWVLKGGAAVEMRIADKARTTKDLDLAARHTGANDADVREALVCWRPDWMNTLWRECSGTVRQGWSVTV
jgi:hypothetical protein